MFKGMASRVPAVVSDTLDYVGEIASAEAGFVGKHDSKSFSGAILKLIPILVCGRSRENGVQLAEGYTSDQTRIDLNGVIGKSSPAYSSAWPHGTA
jgi:hypothetical protein